MEGSNVPSKAEWNSEPSIPHWSQNGTSDPKAFIRLSLEPHTRKKSPARQRTGPMPEAGAPALSNVTLFAEKSMQPIRTNIKHENQATSCVDHLNRCNAQPGVTKQTIKRTTKTLFFCIRGPQTFKTSTPHPFGKRFRVP